MNYAEVAQAVVNNTSVEDGKLVVRATAPIFVLRITDAIVQNAEDRWAVDTALDLIRAASELAHEDADNGGPAIRQMVDRFTEPRFTSFEEAAWWVMNRKRMGLRQSMSDAMAEIDTESPMELVLHAERGERERIASMTLGLLGDASLRDEVRETDIDL